MHGENNCLFLKSQDTFQCLFIKKVSQKKTLFTEKDPKNCLVFFKEDTCFCSVGHVTFLRNSIKTMNSKIKRIAKNNTLSDYNLSKSINILFNKEKAL